MAAYIGHSLLATLATLAVMLPLIVASGILVAWGTAGTLSIGQSAYSGERATLLLVCLILGSFMTLSDGLCRNSALLRTSWCCIAPSKPWHPKRMGKEKKGVVWPLIGAFDSVYCCNNRYAD